MRTIEIKSINIEENVIKAKLLIENVEEVITTTISKEYIKDVTIDRIDAYVLGLLHFALKYEADIISQLPISDELYYNLTQHYIPTIIKAKKIKKISIKAPLIKTINSKGEIVATGISCGIDSLYTLFKHTSSDIPPSHRINTLTFFNVGSSMKGSTVLRTPLVQGRLELANKFANEYKFNFLFIESDIHLFIHKYIGYDHIQHHTFMMLFCTYHLQSVIGKYYYSSGYSYIDFHFGDESASYDLFSFALTSIGKIKYYSTGAEINRIEKTKELINYEPAHKYLNVCVEDINNDCICFKCVRTMLTLDGLKALNKFSKVFNIDKYYKNRFWYLKQLYVQSKIRNDKYMKEIYPLLQHEFTISLKLKIFMDIIKNRLFKR